MRMLTSKIMRIDIAMNFSNQKQKIQKLANYWYEKVQLSIELMEAHGRHG
jgi:hypothetical protein